jgi:ketosteroid isomerase-like protein
MSQAAVETIRSAFQAWNRSVEAVLPYLDPAIEWTVRRDWPDADVYRGHEGFLRFNRTFAEVLDELGIEPEEFAEIGDRVVVGLRWWGRGKASGAAAEEHREAWVFTVEGGKIVEVHEYPTKEEALAAVSGDS